MRTIYWTTTNGRRVKQTIIETDAGLVIEGELIEVVSVPPGARLGRSAPAPSQPRWTRWGDGAAWLIRLLRIRWNCPTCDCRRRGLNCLGLTVWQIGRWFAGEFRLAFGSA